MAISYNPKIVTNGLVGLWDAGNVKSFPGSGTTWKDLTGQSDAILAASPAFNSISPANFVFTGSSAAWIPYVASQAPTAAISFGAWVYSPNWGGVTGTYKILSKTEAGGYALGTNDGYSGLHCNIWITTTGWYRIGVPVSSLSNGWHHVVITFDGKFMKIYIDGILINTGDVGTATTISYAYANNLVIGAEATSGNSAGYSGQQWPGNIAQAFVYNISLSNDQVIQNFNASRGRFGL